jgi:arsenate reductase (glutaredoxin)
MTVTIYHNPACRTSRNVLAMIRRSGEEPVVIEYLKTPPARERLKELIAVMGIPVRALLREKGTPYAELGLGDPKWTDDQLLDFMMAHLRGPVRPGRRRCVAGDRAQCAPPIVRGGRSVIGSSTANTPRSWSVTTRKNGAGVSSSGTPDDLFSALSEQGLADISLKLRLLRLSAIWMGIGNDHDCPCL